MVISKLNIMIKKNPFSDYGGIVTDKRFIGRRKEIDKIENRLLGVSYGNIAIIGLPRIGKSSLVWNTIFEKKNHLSKEKIISVWIPFGEFSSIYEAFDEILFHISEELEQSDLNEYILKIISKIQNSSSNVVKRRYIKKIFKFVKSKGFRVIIALDEFDNAKNILSLQDFQFLRELSYNVETKIGLITISRKTLQDLEPDNGALSNFYQIFTELRLTLFSNDDMDKYWERIEGFGIEISANYKKTTKHFCGSHPYLLDVLNHEVFNQISQSNINLEASLSSIIDDLRLKIYNEYEAILRLMSFEGLDDKLMQIIVGPVYNINQRDVEKLLKYGIIKLSKDKNYSSFSDYFNEYLFLKSSEIDIWPLWTEVENEVRYIIKQYLVEEFGDKWQKGYEKKFKQKKVDEFIKSLKTIQNKNKSSFGENASDHLIDYTYPMDMFDRFIAYDWNWFSKIFNNQKNDWKPIFQHLGKIRNPLAHNNPNFLSDSDKNLAEGYCKLILGKIADWRSKSISL